MEKLKYVPEGVLLEFLTLVSEVKFMEQRIEEIKVLLKSIGSFSTANFVCAVSDQEQVRLKSLQDFEAALGRELLEQKNLIKTINFKIVKVAKKSRVEMIIY